MTSISDILKSHGPLISSDLAKVVQVKQEISYNTASQKVSRSKDIQRIKGFFISKQALCYLPEHAETDLLFDVLAKTMYEYGKKYWYTINAIKLHGGIINRKYLECYTNYPIHPLKSHLPFKIVMQKFVAENILVFNGDNYMFSSRFARKETNFMLSESIELIKDNILLDFNNLSKNIGLISYNSGESFAEFGKFRWAFKGVSPISGLMSGNKFGFLLADILIGKPFYDADIQFLIQKLKYIQNFKNASRIISFILIDNLSPEAFNLLKKNGIIVGFINELFGQKYADTLKELISVLNNAGASLKETPDRYIDLIKELKKYNEGLANNIRGTLFEFVVGHLHSKYTNSSIDLGRKVFENSGWHDIDVLAVYPDKVVFSECKAYKAQIDIEAIDNWLGVKIPAFRKWLIKQETLINKDVEFEYWSTSGFTEEALSKLQNISNSVKKYKVTIFQTKDIREKALSMKDKKLKEILNDFFLKPKV